MNTQSNFTKNAVKFIKLYKKGTTWGFDEPVLGLVFEPFVAGASEVIQDIRCTDGTIITKDIIEQLLKGLE